MNKSLLMVAVILLVHGTNADSAQVGYSKHFSSSDYGFLSQDAHSDSVFDQLPEAEVGAGISWGSSCGKMDLKTNLKASLNGILQADSLFDKTLTNIFAEAPMLATCYLSPTWCNILKHGQLSAQLSTQTRLDQCSLIDRYVDSRSQASDEDLQACVRENLQNNGGDLNSAIDQCKKSEGQTFVKWGGSRQRGESNKLLDSSADWAGMNQSQEGKESVGLLKGLVGDLTQVRGSLQIEYGSRQKPLTPRVYLSGLQNQTYKSLCQKMMDKIIHNSEQSAESLVSIQELRALAPKSPEPVVDWQTLRSLASMPKRQQQFACKKLSDQIAMIQFTGEMNRSLDLLTVMAQNPNLPDARKRDLENKRQALKESIEMTVALRGERNQGMSAVLGQINAEGEKLRHEKFQETVHRDESVRRNQDLKGVFYDCSDPEMCDESSMERR